jgi:hypothetical protein
MLVCVGARRENYRDDLKITAACSGRKHTFSRQASNIDLVIDDPYFLYGSYSGDFKIGDVAARFAADTAATSMPICRPKVE